MRKNIEENVKTMKIQGNSNQFKSNLEILHQLAATINHEINNPLTSIIGQAEISEIAYDNGMEETLRKSLQNIIKQAERIRLVTQKLENLEQINTEDYVGHTKIINLM